MTIAQLISDTRFSHLDEASLQASIAALIQAEHPALTVEREVKIGEGERIDLIVGDTLGIEVKVAGSLAMVLRQLRRYANTRRLDALILVTTRVAHRELDGVTLSGVQVRVVIPAWL